MNGIEISIGLSNFPVHLNFKKVIVEGKNNDIYALDGHTFLLHSDWNIIQPPLSFTSSQFVLPVRHHKGNESEQVILFLYLGVGSYGPNAIENGYTTNVLEKNEVYGYGVMLFNVLISKHIDDKWKQAHSHMLGLYKVIPMVNTN